nr:uncharacterized protein LOC128688329 isoform X2 [Cherax quadricarinatus]
MPFTQTHAPFLTKTLLGPINTMYIFLDNTVGDVAISGSLSANFTPPYLAKQIPEQKTKTRNRNKPKNNELNKYLCLYIF